MGEQRLDDHLSRISTVWENLVEAHDHDSPTRREAQSAVFQRYSRAIYSYLRQVVGNADAADELFQQFALAFVQGDFRHADPRKGRFRDYLKASLFRLVSRYRQSRSRDSLHPDEHSAWEAYETPEQLTAAVDVACRDHLLVRAWVRLREWEDRTGRLYFTVLDYRSHHPQSSSRQIAEHLAAKHPQRTWTPEGIRKTLQRARMKFADFLLDELAVSLGDPTDEELEEDLVDLGLHAHCRSALGRRIEFARGPTQGN